MIGEGTEPQAGELLNSPTAAATTPRPPIERDACTIARGYAPGTRADGIEVRDRVWLDLPLDAEP